MKKSDILIGLLLIASVLYIDFDKNAVKALISGGVIGWWINRKLKL